MSFSSSDARSVVTFSEFEIVSMILTQQKQVYPMLAEAALWITEQIAIFKISLAKQVNAGEKDAWTTFIVYNPNHRKKMSCILTNFSCGIL